MRLSESQRSAILGVAKDYFKDGLEDVLLYGSRTDPSLKGGDIDLVFLVLKPDERFKDYELLVLLKKHPSIGQRKIDLKILTRLQLDSDTFFKRLHFLSLIENKTDS